MCRSCEGADAAARVFFLLLAWAGGLADGALEDSAGSFRLLSASSATLQEGPGVDSAASGLCGNTVLPLDFAVHSCHADPNCQALHYNCDTKEARLCSVGLGALSAVGSGTDACTMVYPVDLTTATTSTTTTVDMAPNYIAGPMVDNGAILIHCNSGTGTLASAAAGCDAEPACTVLLSYQCLDWAWAYCTSTVDVIQDYGSGSGSCSRVRRSTTSTATSVTSTATATTTTRTATSGTGTSATDTSSTVTSLTVVSETSSTTTSVTLTTLPPGIYFDGPMVTNFLDVALCDGPAMSLQDAMAACDAMLDCSVLHSYGCHAWTWRACGGSFGDIVAAGSGAACTKVNSLYMSTTATSTTDSSATVTSTTATSTFTRHLYWESGPRVDNAANDGLCAEEVSTLEEAQASCVQDPGCTVVHSYKCLGWAWRHCSASIGELQAAGPGTGSCTMVGVEASGPTTTKSATATVPPVLPGVYIDGPMVDGDAFLMGSCSDVPSSLEAAQAACDADPACYFLHSFDCMGWAWRHCSGSLHAVLDAGSGSSCIKVHSSFESIIATSTTSATSSTTTPYYVDGPRVDNVAADGGRCSAAVFTLEEAQQSCNADPSCSGVLHSYKCFSWAWRHCSSSIEELEAVGPGTDACTKVVAHLTTGTMTTESSTTLTSTSVTTSSMTTGTTTTITVTTTSLFFVDGPMVGNQAWKGHCSTDVHTLAGAEAACASNEGCLVLHSFSCEDWAWRYCTGDIADIQASSIDALACTKVESRLITSTISVTLTTLTTATGTTVSSSGTATRTTGTATSTTTTATSTATSFTTTTATTVTHTATTVTTETASSTTSSSSSMTRTTLTSTTVTSTTATTFSGTTTSSTTTSGTTTSGTTSSATTASSTDTTSSATTSSATLTSSTATSGTMTSATSTSGTMTSATSTSGTMSSVTATSSSASSVTATSSSVTSVTTLTTTSATTGSTWTTETATTTTTLFTETVVTTATTQSRTESTVSVTGTSGTETQTSATQTSPTSMSVALSTTQTATYAGVSGAASLTTASQAVADDSLSVMSTTSTSVVSILGSMTLKVDNATAFLEDAAAQEAVRAAVASAAGVRAEQVVGLEFSVQLRRRRLVLAPSLERERPAAGAAVLLRGLSAAAGDEQVSVAFAIAAGGAEASQVQELLQAASPSSMAAALEQALQEAGLGEVYGDVGVASLSVDVQGATDPSLSGSAADADGDGGNGNVAMAAIAALLAMLACAVLVSGVVLFVARRTDKVPCLRKEPAGEHAGQGVPSAEAVSQPQAGGDEPRASPCASPQRPGDCPGGPPPHRRGPPDPEAAAPLRHSGLVAAAAPARPRGDGGTGTPAGEAPRSPRPSEWLSSSPAHEVRPAPDWLAPPPPDRGPPPPPLPGRQRAAAREAEGGLVAGALRGEGAPAESSLQSAPLRWLGSPGSPAAAAGQCRGAWLSEASGAGERTHGRAEAAPREGTAQQVMEDVILPPTAGTAPAAAWQRLPHGELAGSSPCGSGLEPWSSKVAVSLQVRCDMVSDSALSYNGN